MQQRIYKGKQATFLTNTPLYLRSELVCGNSKYANCRRAPKSKMKVRSRIVTKKTLVSKALKKPDYASKLMFTCCWKRCATNLNSAMDLDLHVREHLESDVCDDPFRCHWDACTFSTSCTKELHRHVYYHGYHTSLMVIGREECKKADVPVCSHTDANRNTLPELKHDFECMWLNCKRFFASIVEFQDHIALHSSFDYDMLKTPDENQPNAKCNWQFCKKIFKNKYRLSEHTRMHSNQKLFGCFECGELFRTKTTLFDHCRRQEINNTHKYQCRQCFKFYATEKLLRNHFVIHVNCFKCSMCDMTCNSSNSLATHIRYRHLKDRPIKCPECEHRCVTKSDLAKHKRHAHSKVMQRCGEIGCNYTVKTYNCLRRHYLEVHANSPFIYLCHCCDKLFKYGKLLSKHLITKHNFQLPSGHKRFTYRIDENGFYSLETTRIESLEVTRQILSPVLLEMSELTEDSSNYEIVSITNADNLDPATQEEDVQKIMITLDED